MYKTLSLVTFFASAVFAASNTPTTTTPPPSGSAMMMQAKGSGPCPEIVAICKNAGFKPGDWKNGDGLWRDCVDPIVQGDKTVKGGTEALPSVSQDLIDKCKAARPNFGKGKVGS